MPLKLPSSLLSPQEEAARSYDLAALACKGPGAAINFTEGEYTEQLKEIEGLSRVGLGCV